MKKTLIILTLATMLLAQETKFYPIQLGSMLFTHIEMVDTDEGRIKGLMNRKELAYDGGMLFVFQNEDVLSFWMRNTLIPLDIIYMDKNGVVTAIHTMKTEPPQASNESDAAYCARLPLYSSIKPAKYALELNAGMASEIKVGDKIKLPSLK